MICLSIDETSKVYNEILYLSVTMKLYLLYKIRSVLSPHIDEYCHNNATHWNSREMHQCWSKALSEEPLLNQHISPTFPLDFTWIIQIQMNALHSAYLIRSIHDSYHKKFCMQEGMLLHTKSTREIRTQFSFLFFSTWIYYCGIICWK